MVPQIFPPPPLPDCVRQWDGVRLSELNSVRLMNRVDTKYVAPASLLDSLFQRLNGKYRVLTFGECQRGAAYQTLYFDTQDFAAYRSHHNQVPDRYKVRSRRYLDTNTTFLEVKHRLKSGRSQKVRIEVDSANPMDQETTQRWLCGRHPFPTLLPRLFTNFTRLTLVDHQMTERITVDLSLAFRTPNSTSDQVGLARTAIIEVKQHGFSRGSAMVRLLRAHGVRPASFSKYCVGCALSFPQLKKNRFKETLRSVKAHQ